MSTITENARSTTEDNLWATLNATATDTPSTAAELATAAGIGASTARKILARWGVEGSVTRHDDDDNPRAAVRWSITSDTAPTAPDTAFAPIAPLEHEAAQPEPDTVETTVATDTDEAAPTAELEAAPTPDTDAVEKPRENDATEQSAVGDQASSDGETPDEKPAHLPSGGLRGLVEDHLRDHPGESFSPHQISKALGRSSGAIHNALVKLTDTGVATRTCEAPKKFALAEQENHIPQPPTTTQP
ncbi:hypothetical protein [Nocardia salmonicida]|uniref:hypothetical protein n=1 Tax=Nocardia salmonicida TaxID=53431 RepID=UPI003CFB07D5